MKREYMKNKYSHLITDFGGVIKYSFKDTPYIRIRCKENQLGKVFRLLAYNYGPFYSRVINNDCYEIMLNNSVRVEMVGLIMDEMLMLTVAN